MGKFVISFLLVGALLIAGCSSGHVTDEEFLKRDVIIGGNSYGYRVYLPPDRQPGKKLPVMLYLHGSNRRGNDNQAQVLDLLDVMRTYPANFPFIMVFPQCRENTFWAGPMMEQSMAALDQTISEFDGDENRIFIAGYSMGGFGAWQGAMTYPKKFSALVAVAGGIEQTGRASDEDRSLLSPQVVAALRAPDPYAAYAETLARLPVWVVHGAEDAAVPVEGARKIVAALRAAGDKEVNYDELAGVGHGVVRTVFSDPRLSKWLKKRIRIPEPDQSVAKLIDHTVFAGELK